MNQDLLRTFLTESRDEGGDVQERRMPTRDALRDAFGDTAEALYYFLEQNFADVFDAQLKIATDTLVQSWQTAAGLVGNDFPAASLSMVRALGEIVDAIHDLAKTFSFRFDVELVAKIRRTPRNDSLALFSTLASHGSNAGAEKLASNESKEEKLRHLAEQLERFGRALLSMGQVLKHLGVEDSVARLLPALFDQLLLELAHFNESSLDSGAMVFYATQLELARESGDDAQIARFLDKIAQFERSFPEHLTDANRIHASNRALLRKVGDGISRAISRN